jgi:hypothetical protein
MRGMLAIIQLRNVCLLVCYLKGIKVKIYENIIQPLGSYGCETCSLTLK